MVCDNIFPKTNSPAVVFTQSAASVNDTNGKKKKLQKLIKSIIISTSLKKDIQQENSTRFVFLEEDFKVNASSCFIDSCNQRISFARILFLPFSEYNYLIH